MAQSTLAAHTPEAGYPTVSPVAERGSPVELRLLALIALLCAALRGSHLSAASLWTDEVFSRYYAQLFGWHYLFTTGLSTEATPPTYSLLLQGWMHLWGGTEAAMRSFSAVASVLCVPVIYALGKGLAGKRQGVLAALLFAISPVSQYFAQEARVYALFMLVTSLALWGTAKFLLDERSESGLALYTLFAVFAIYLHGTGVLFVAACALAAGLYFLGRGAGGLQPLVKWTACNLAVVLVGLPYFLHEAQASRGGGLDWIPPTTIRNLVYCVSRLISGILTPYPWPAFALAALVVIALALSLFFAPPGRRQAVVLIGVPALFVTLVYALGLRRPILLPRILSWMVVPLCLLAARQILSQSRARYAVLLSITAAFAGGLFVQLHNLSSDKEPWRDALQAYGPQLQKADLVVLSPLFDPMVLSYYAPRVQHARLWDAGLRPTIMTAAAQRLQIAPITEAEIDKAIAEKHSVWILSNAFDLPRVDAMRNQFPSTDFHVWSCGKVNCVGVAGWQPVSPPLTGSSLANRRPER